MPSLPRRLLRRFRRRRRSGRFRSMARSRLRLRRRVVLAASPSPPGSRSRLRLRRRARARGRTRARRFRFGVMHRRAQRGRRPGRDAAPVARAQEAQRGRRGEGHPQVGRQLLDAFAGGERRVFDAERRVLALERALTQERAPDSGVQLQQPELQRHDPDQRERDQRDQPPAPDQALQQGVTGEPPEDRQRRRRCAPPLRGLRRARPTACGTGHPPRRRHAPQLALGRLRPAAGLGRGGGGRH